MVDSVGIRVLMKLTSLLRLTMSSCNDLNVVAVIDVAVVGDEQEGVGGDVEVCSVSKFISPSLSKA